MKYMLLFFFLFSSVLSMAQRQSKNPLENVVITSEKDKTQVRTSENGELLINVSPKDVLKFKANGLVRYSDFGAMGDGKPMIQTPSLQPMHSPISRAFV